MLFCLVGGREKKKKLSLWGGGAVFGGGGGGLRGFNSKEINSSTRIIFWPTVNDNIANRHTRIVISAMCIFYRVDPSYE